MSVRQRLSNRSVSPIERPHHMKERRLPRPGRTRHGNELPRLDVKVYSTQRLDGHCTRILARDTLESDHPVPSLPARMTAGSIRAAHQAG